MELPTLGLEDLVDNEDYYSLLNASKDATPEELKSSYRRLCMIYHPDKHDQSKHKDASDIFRKIQTAYSVLSDSTKRHIYDNYGTKGLQADWQIVERKKTPEEIQEEFDRIQRLKAQHLLEEKTNPKGTFSMTVNATSLFDSPYAEEDEYYDEPLVLPEITKMSLSQSIETPLTLSHTATLSGNVESDNGNGSGHFTLALRSAVSRNSWGEFEVDVTDAKQINFGLKGYRTLGNGLFALVHIPVRTYFSDDTIAIARPDLNCTVGHVLGKDLLGSLEFGIGNASHMSTNIVKETPRYRLNAKAQLGIPHSFGIVGATLKFPEDQGSLRISVKAGTFGCVVEYGGEHRVSQFSTVAAHLSIGVPLGVALKLRINRSSHSYIMPIILSDEINFIAAFYGTILPITFYAALQALLIRPYKRKEKKRKEEEDEKALVDETRRRQAEAEGQVEMMKQSTERKIEIEERKKGLIIVEACYGCLVSDQSLATGSKLVDVTIPLQNLVENSSLQLPTDITKSGLPGFYDPSPAREKKLKIIYKFRGGLHQVIIDDKDGLRIPLRSHMIEIVQ